LPKDAIKTITLSTPKILAAALSKKKQKKIQMPGAARAGIGLLLMGALLVGFGQYLERGALSLYGVIIVACGFTLYMTASVIAKRRAKI
jgi:protein-S-isoprenylcysteine O-methyltransferase Ste14